MRGVQKWLNSCTKGGHFDFTFHFGSIIVEELCQCFDRKILSLALSEVEGSKHLRSWSGWPTCLWMVTWRGKVGSAASNSLQNWFLAGAKAGWNYFSGKIKKNFVAFLPTVCCWRDNIWENEFKMLWSPAKNSCSRRSQLTGPIHTGRDAQCDASKWDLLMWIRSVHTGCKQHQRKNVRICTRVLCGLGLCFVNFCFLSCWPVHTNAFSWANANEWSAVFRYSQFGRGKSWERKSLENSFHSIGPLLFWNETAFVLFWPVLAKKTGAKKPPVYWGVEVVKRCVKIETNLWRQCSFLKLLKHNVSRARKFQEFREIPRNSRKKRTLIRKKAAIKFWHGCPCRKCIPEPCVSLAGKCWNWWKSCVWSYVSCFKLSFVFAKE